MIHVGTLLAAGVLPALKHFVSATELHPILVNFTAALVPVSVASDAAARLWKSEPLRGTARWTLTFAAAITPLTVATGWLFWMSDDNGVAGMTIHKWLGTGLVAVLFGLFAWRLNLHRRQRWATVRYLLAGAVLVAALVYQGHLGGHQVFSGM